MQKFLSLLFLVVTSQSALANDTAVGGSGSSPMPITENNVKMKSEHIVISGRDINNKNMHGAWEITGDYVFENTTDKPLNFKMGFPLPILESEEMVAYPAGHPAKVGDPMVYDFTITINGQPTPVSQEQLMANDEKHLDYKQAYTWDVSFAPHEILNIHHHYLTGVTINVMGYTPVNYVFKTGGLWQEGLIGDAKIEIRPNTPTKLCHEVDKRYQEYAKTTPSAPTILANKNQRIYTWHFTRWHPTDDLDVCLITGRNFVHYNIVYPILQASPNEKTGYQKMSSHALQILRNTIYAQYGRTFSDPTLQSYFNKQWWYQPNTAYSDTDLSPEDKQALMFINELEIKKK